MKKIVLYTIVLFLPVCLFSQKIKKSPGNRSFRISKNLNIFNTVFRELDANYVDTLNYDKVVKGAVDNMLEKLDPYTVYMPEEETDDLKFMTTGEYAGIGALIMKKDKDVCVSEPYEGMPAQRNGVKAGDVIVEIDGVNVLGKSVSDVSARLKGTPNTNIKLKLKRPGEKSLVSLTFKREKIQVNPVAYYQTVGPSVGYVQLNEFTERAGVEVKKAINELLKKDQIQSLVLDLRNNGGGLVDEAVSILGYFLPKGTEVVTTKGKTEESFHVYKTPSEPLFPGMKLVLLVNRSSASASEILSGAIQDMDRGVIVGERTYGKGLVQNIRPVDFGGHLKVTVAKYYIPSGRCIQAIDYSHRNDDGSVGRVPDSLTHVFKTLHGRKVRDGGGVVPDTITVKEKNINIAYYIYAQNLYFDFATDYVLKHPSIARPEEFKLTDDEFNSFTAYLKEKKFTYTTQTEKSLDELMEVAKYEGLDKRAKNEFAELKARLKPDIVSSISENKDDVADMLTLEIIKRYYYQKGQIIYSLRSDKDLKAALEILKSEIVYKNFLNGNKK